jgi:hypothetical protein
MAETVNIPREGGKGVTFSREISLGSILTFALVIVSIITGYTTFANRQSFDESVQAAQGVKIEQISERLQTAAELNAREAAIVEELEARLNRYEEETKH